MKCKTLVRTDQLTRDEWLAHRRNGIGGSDAGSILGINRYASPYTVWADKTGLATPEFNGNEATEWGNDLERVVAEKYARTSGDIVVAIPVLLQSEANPFMLANVDFFILSHNAPYGVPGQITDLDNYEDTAQHIIAILEIKTTGIAGRGNASAWADNGVPATYEAQGLHYCAVTGLDKVVFAALIGGQGLVVRERIYTYDQAVELINAERKFWAQVEANEEPEATGSDLDLLKFQYPESQPGVEVEADDFVASDIELYATLNREMSELEAKYKAVRARLEQFIGSAETVTYEGNVLLTYKSNKPRTALNTKALTEAHPDLIAQFTEAKPGARVLRIKEAK